MRREVLDSGEAYIIIEYSKDERKLTQKELARNIDYRKYQIRKELQDKGYIVTKVYALIHGGEGDMKVCAKWVKLGGPKKTKRYRRAHAASHDGNQQVAPEGHNPVSEGDSKTPLPL